MAVAPEARNLAPSPGEQSPSFSYMITSLDDAASWHSTTSRSAGPMPAISYAAREACTSGETRPPPGIPDRSTDARTRTASSRSGATSAASITTAAAPSATGAHMTTVSGSAMTRPASTCSLVRGVRYWAYGFRAAAAEFLTATSAKSSLVAPERSMYFLVTQEYIAM
jgi:hypothetical protein